MKLERAHPVAIFITSMLAVAAFCVAEQNAAVATLGLGGLPLTWWLRAKCMHWFTDPSGRGGEARWGPIVSVRTQVAIVMNAIALAAVAYAFYLGLRDGVRVEHIATLVVVLIVLKGFDRFTARDYGQILALAVFLGIAAVLTSVRFEVGLVMTAFVPALASAVMLHQIRGAQEWASRGPRGSAMSHKPVIAGRGAARQFRWLVAVNVAGALAGATVVFLLIPRGIGQGAFGDWGAAPSGSQTRFTPNVELGRGGFISTSPTVVMHVEISDGQHRLGGTNRVYYLRGNILDSYNSRGRRWERGEEGRQANVGRTTVMAGEPRELGPRSISPLIQRITILNADNDEQYLFHALMPSTLEMDREIEVRRDFDTGRLAVRRVRGELRYTVHSSEIERPRGPPTQTFFDSPPIRELAERIISDANVNLAAIEVDPAASAAAARALESYLRGNYMYTLDILAAPTDVDPIEWFLFESRQGHCEYFASALAAMCRSIGVNARVVAGYVAAEWNENSRHYVVRESNAHAWVEAEHGRGNWRTYDATPPSDLERQHRPSDGVFSWFRRAFDAMSYAWNSSIISFDSGTRDRLRFSDRGSRSDWFTQVIAMVDKVRFGGVRMVVRALIVGLGVFAVIAASALLVRLVVVTGVRRRKRQRGAKSAASGDDVALWIVPAGLYERMLRIAAVRGTAKPAWQPPIAHASAIEPRDPSLAHALTRIADLFYQARFGAKALTPEEVAEAERLIDAMRTEAINGVRNSPHR